MSGPKNAYIAGLVDGTTSLVNVLRQHEGYSDDGGAFAGPGTRFELRADGIRVVARRYSYTSNNEPTAALERGELLPYLELLLLDAAGIAKRFDETARKLQNELGSIAVDVRKV